MFRTAAALAERLQSILLFTELLLITHQKIQAEVLQDTVDCDQGQTGATLHAWLAVVFPSDGTPTAVDRREGG